MTDINISAMERNEASEEGKNQTKESSTDDALKSSLFFCRLQRKLRFQFVTLLIKVHPPHINNKMF